ncbi:MAG: 16S rRNA (cytosine(967)-C(5))-methyltransferase RsmB [Bacillota bacterium]|nr:16S rRNA (cytosine(967)-C(5))-methyltransferase RsmB [Bacillota bacterium]
MKTQKNVRETAMDLLEAIEKNQSYSNLLLHQAILKNEIPSKDVGLLTELIYGTLQRKMTLDFYLNPFVKKSSKTESWVMNLLRLTLYQMVYLDKIPDRAAIYEAVEIAKKRGHKGISGMVNGVMRSIQREGLPSLDEIMDSTERLSIETSHPKWLVSRWIEQFGFDATKEMCEINLTAPLQTARVNLTKTTREECLKVLEEEGFQAEASPFIREGIRALKGNLALSSAYRQGLFSIQDESSMLVAYALGASENETILDACAAPGGKSTHVAEQMGATGKVISLDLHEHKVKLINDNAQRLELQNIQTIAMDSRRVGERFEKESFDRVLLDAPCSGLGVMRRKPDIKYTKTEKDLAQLSTIQHNLLDAVAPLVKKGGILVYSTCTVDNEENQYVTASFLKEHPEFEGDADLSERMPEAIRQMITGYETQIFPQTIGSDGFYIACLRKKV